MCSSFIITGILQIFFFFFTNFYRSSSGIVFQAQRFGVAFGFETIIQYCCLHSSGPPTCSTAFRDVLILIFVLTHTVEHTASILTGIGKAIPCSTGGVDIFRAYFSMNFRQVFTIVHYSLIIALPLGFLNLILTCAWNYMDLFIIILACALSDKFKQLNQKLASVKGKVCNSVERIVYNHFFYFYYIF